MSQKKILIRVDANPIIGLGHFYRCLSLAHMLKKAFSVEFAISEPSNLIEKELENTDFKFIALQAFQYLHPDEREESAEIPFDITSIISDYHILVLDGYWFGQKYIEEVKKHHLSIALIEDKGFGNYPVDLIINHALGLDPERYEGATYLALGAPHVLLRPSFLKEAQQLSVKKEHLQKILICFGGADAKNYTHKLAQAILEKTNLDVHIVLGGAYQHKKQIDELTLKFINRVEVSSDLGATEMIEAMKNAHLGIVPSSGILLECIACGLPVISGIYAENQRKIFEGFLDKKVIINGGNFDSDHIIRELNSLTIDRQQEIQRLQKQLIDGYSGERLISLFQKL